MATDRNLHISSAFPYEKQSVEALGNRMAYVDVGSSSSGPVAVFLHGNPNSSYLWRNIFSHVSKDNRCVVPDLIGFGDSDKVTGLEYRIRDHQRYIDAFLDAVLPTGRITFVIHDWSSALGLDWASRHHERVAGLALMEWITALSSWASRDLVFQDHFRTFRTQDVGRALIIEQNFFVDTILTMGVVRGLTEEEMIHYRRPFLKPKDREPIWRLPNEIPIEGHPEDVWENAHRYTPWLLAWNLPKLFFWVTLERSSRKRTL
ncbi:alpha/beta-hydrolase [Trichoderma reesei RUT C-30]|jgi:haloalkane dehalogenase|uniref:Alpha/beta-hydrolase n=1 Tax=Hypocrea jecorina (strain ATCC 56765 / BCRC 32924 / NRRL 11460 / Rut C-30) TaxID=1344414 RepID=A0A024SDY9_HYPJR|nr:alpha/beta-hydrolase [Trichoderma reesei RUT C-30]